jgi:hypothetical protein
MVFEWAALWLTSEQADSLFAPLGQSWYEVSHWLASSHLTPPLGQVRERQLPESSLCTFRPWKMHGLFR